jgi:cysteine synthase A
LDTKIIDSVVSVTDDEATQMAASLARREGLLVGVSAGANVFAAAQVAGELGPDQTVVTVLPDTGERYVDSPA